MNNIFMFWTGDNPMSERRAECLKSFKEECGCYVKLITPGNMVTYILIGHPLHPAYQYLSETHKADYLRTYFMHFYGSGYSDIKRTTGDWNKAFLELRNSDKLAIGYKEVHNGVPHQLGDLVNRWEELIGNTAYIFKARTPLTEEWYTGMLSVCDKYLDDLKKNPATFPQDCAEVSDGKYPIGWNELLGRVFHRAVYKYRDRIDNTLPISIFENYR